MMNCTWFPSDYEIEIYVHLKNLEKERYVFCRRSPQIEYRSKLVKWLKHISNMVKFCRLTLHLSVFLLDLFMDSHAINPEKLNLIACICFVLAGKFEEREAIIPRVTDINKLLNSSYQKSDIVYLEKLVLDHFKWRLAMPTSLHFAHFFLDHVVVEEEICQHVYPSFEKLCSQLRNTAVDMLDIMLDDEYLVQESPSFVAASCILAVRKLYKLVPHWPKRLEDVTGYSEVNLLKCSSRMIEFRYANDSKMRKRKLEVSPDLGYESEKGSPCAHKCIKKC